MQAITIEPLHGVNRITISRSCFPEQNMALIIGIIGSLTSANGPVVNHENYLVFNFDARIPQSILYDFFQRWGVNVDDMSKI